VGVEQHGDDAHGLLGVVAAVAERIERGGDELQRSEGAVDGRRGERTNSQETASTSSSANTKPNAGETTMPAAVLPRPSQTIAFSPALADPAPTRPPTRACDDDEGMPASQVMTFQAIAPISAPKISRSVTNETATMPEPMVLATCRPKNRKAMKLKSRGPGTA
jgi:hypothetical protein